MLSAPNLPGFVIQSDSQYYRSMLGRPQSATLGLPLRKSASDFRGIVEEVDARDRERPSTANARMNFTGGKGMDQTNPDMEMTKSIMPGKKDAPKVRSSATLQYAKSKEFIQTKSAPVLPKYVEADRIVCRFYGHFLQRRTWEHSDIGTSDIESHIGRRLTIMYHVADDTVEINEDKTENTGLQGGRFFRRGRLYKAKSTSEHFTLREFLPGNDIEALGVKIHLTDADKFTRGYFRREFNIKIPEATERPSDIQENMGAQYATGLGRKVAGRLAFNATSFEYLDKRNEMQKTYNFLHLDGQILRFECVEVPVVDGVLSEEFTPLSTMRKYVLAFYLADDTVELRAAKDDTHENRLVLKRTKLARNWRDVAQNKKPVPFQASDFVCGSTIDIYGRIFFLLKCDEFSRQVFQELGVEQEEIPVAEVVEEQIVHPIPKVGEGYLQIGRPEDTLATVFGQAKKIRAMKGREGQKAIRNQNRLIRCKLKMITDNQIDTTRNFNLTYFLEDDTVQIFEEVLRNAGIVGGHFLKRGKFDNMLPPDADEPRPFKPSDIYLGNVLGFHGYEFRICEMDDMSMQFCETSPDEFPMFDIFRIVHNLADQVVAQGIDVRKVFQNVDVTHGGWVEQEIFISTLDRLNLTIQLSDQELMTLMRRFRQDDKFFYHELADMFVYSFSVSHRAYLARDVNAIGSIELKSFLQTARKRSTQWRRVFRKDAACIDGGMTLPHLVQVFKRHGQSISPSEKQSIATLFSVPREFAVPILMKIAANESSKSNNSLSDKGTASSRSKVARVDVRSKTRLASSMKGSTEGDHAAALAQTIKQKRHAMTRSVIRGHLVVEEEIFPASEEKNIVIDFHRLCDSIYTCGWAR